MKIFGKEKHDGDRPLSLQEVTLVVNPSEVDVLIKFLSHCKEGMGSNSEWEHLHLRDFSRKKTTSLPDVVVFASSKLSA
jgi:hypothetical protein